MYNTHPAIAFSRLALLLLTLSIVGAVAHAREWVAYSSENFTLYSDRRESAIEDTLKQFELFRIVALEMLGVPQQPDNERLRIFLFDRDVDFNRLQDDRDVGGFFYETESGSRMLISPTGRRRVLFHEYAHYVMSQHSNVNYPHWYKEGLASLLESVLIDSEGIRVGLPAGSYLARSQFADSRGDYVKPAPIADMVAINPRVWASAFYSTAWLMTHYLLIDSVDDPMRISQTTDYLLRYDAGEDPVEALTASFGMTPSQLDEQLDHYSRNLTFKTIVLPAMQYDGAISARELTEDQSLYLLADLSVELGQKRAADDYLDRFERKHEDSSLVPLMQSLRALSHIHNGNFEDGDALFAELDALDVFDIETAANLIHYAADRVEFARAKAHAWDESLLRRTIALGESAIQREPNNLATLYHLGRAYELDRQLESAAGTLLKFYSINPSISKANLLLAKVFIELGNTEVGAQLVARAVSASHSDETRLRLAEIQERIDDTDFATDSLEAMLTGFE